MNIIHPRSLILFWGKWRRSFSSISFGGKRNGQKKTAVLCLSLTFCYFSPRAMCSRGTDHIVLSRRENKNVRYQQRTDLNSLTFIPPSALGDEASLSGETEGYQGIILRRSHGQSEPCQALSRITRMVIFFGTFFC